MLKRSGERGRNRTFNLLIKRHAEEFRAHVASTTNDGSYFNKGAHGGFDQMFVLSSIVDLVAIALVKIWSK